MIDRGDIRQAIDRCKNIWASLPGAFVATSSSIRLTAWLQNSKKRAERSERLMASRVTATISCLVICIIVCLSWAVNHYRDNAITYKAQRDKNAREPKLANAAITDMQMRHAMLLRSMQNTRRSWLMLKRKWCSAWCDVAAGRRRLHIKAVCRQCVKPPPLPADTQPPPDWQTPRMDWSHLRERLITMQKQLEGTQKYINEQCR